MFAFALWSLPGCYGSFQLTRHVYAFNEAITQDPALREALFVGFLIVPVYELSALVDGLVLNSIEFVDGENPLARGQTADGRRVAVTREPDGSLTLAVEGHRVRRLLARGHRLELVEGEAVLAVVEPTDDGGARVTIGGEVRDIAPAEVRRLRTLEGPALVRAIASSL